MHTIEVLHVPGVCRGGGGDTQEFFVLGGFANTLNCFKYIFARKGTPSYTFDGKRYPFHMPTEEL